MVVVADSMMTFFGSTANDAAFNAWTADIATNEQRGRVEGVLNLSVFMAQIVAMVAAGMLIDQCGVFHLFLHFRWNRNGGWPGGGQYCCGMLRLPEASEPRGSFWSEFSDLFDLDTLRQNRESVHPVDFHHDLQHRYASLISISDRLPGKLHRRHKSEFSIIGGAVMLGSALVAIPFGLLADRWNKRLMIALALTISCIGGILLSLVNTLPLLALTGFIWQAFSVAVSIASVAWLKDLLPEQNRGKFLGIRMIFWIAIPMVVGPWIGSQLIQNYGIPTTLNGQAGFIPVPIIFQVGSLIALLALIPLFFIRPRDKMNHALNSV